MYIWESMLDNNSLTVVYEVLKRIKSKTTRKNKTVTKNLKKEKS